MVTHNPLKLSLNYSAPAALLQPDARGQPRHILLVIDWEHATITAETRDPNLDGMPETRWRGMEDAYPLPPLVDATQLREWVEEEVLPRAAPLADAYRTIWEDVEKFGRFPGHEDEKVEFDRWMAMNEPPMHTGGLWRVAEWLPDIADEVFPDSTDERLARIALEIEHEAEVDGVVFVEGDGAVLALLKEIRDEMRERAPSTPDRYEIEGYEVLERVPRAYSRQSSATLYLPLEWANKRVKVVRLDP
jgi:hypothetical protein